MNKDEELLRSKDVAKILGCTPDEVIALARTGKIRAIKMGKIWRYRLEEVNHYRRRLKDTQ